MRAKPLQIAMRVDADLLSLIDQVTELVARRSITGEAPPKSEVMRAGLRKGLEAMAADLKRARRK